MKWITAYIALQCLLLLGASACFAQVASGMNTSGLEVSDHLQAWQLRSQLTTPQSDVDGLASGVASITDVSNNYMFSTLDAPAYAINDNGEILTRDSCFLWEYGVGGLNDRGDIVGYTTSPWPVVQEGFFIHKGFTTMLNYPGSEFTWASGINDRGQVIGGYYTPGLPGAFERGYVYDGTTYTSVVMPNVARTEPHAINNNGVIVGSEWDGGDAPHGFASDGTNFVQVDAFIGPSGFPSPGTFLWGINDIGQIVGSFWGPTGYGYIALILEDRKFGQISYPGALWTVPLGINNRGQIVGYYSDGSQCRGSWHRPS